MLAHPARTELLGRLIERLPGETVEIVTDEVSPWQGMQRVLGLDVGTDHVVVLQDDALPCVNFPAAVRSVRDAAPERLVSLFHAGQPRRSALIVRQAAPGTLVELEFSRGSDWLPSVALLWPASLVARFRNYRWPGTSRQRGDDLPLGQFARLNGGAVACVPSIVEHPDDHDSTWRTRYARHGRDPLYTACRWSEDGSPWGT